MTDHMDPQPNLQDEAYHARDAVATATRSTLVAGTAGLLVASVQNTLQRQNVGAFGVFTRFGRTVGMFAGMGASYSMIATFAANLREKEDPYNHFMGGFAAGMIRGLFRGTMVATVGNGAFLGFALAGVNFAGGQLLGRKNVDEGRWPTKEETRRRFRRPINETINEIGEGRGIYGENYDERRKQRLKENYGLDIPDPYYKTA